MTTNPKIDACWLEQLGDNRGTALREKSIDCLSESYAHFLRGYTVDVRQMILDGRMAAGTAKGQNITIAPISFYSLCEHHMLPFFGTAEITYTAGDYILGLGKFPRVVEAISARLNLQEYLTAAIADSLFENLLPQKLSVTLHARHLCLEMRGTEASGVMLKTSVTKE